MNENKRTKSISRKINRNMVLKLISAFLTMDLLLVILAVSLWCYSVESASGIDLSLLSYRRFDSVAALEKIDEDEASGIDDALRDYEASIDGNQRQLLPVKTWKTALSKSVYLYGKDENHKNYAYAGSFLINLFTCLSGMILVECLVLLGTALSGARTIRRYLAPLDELAFKARVLGDATHFDQQAMNELEHAINTISPTREGAHLHTGNTEMERLESSINGLLDRMRETYKQQSRFVSDASHELRTPISVLQGYVNMLDRWGKDDEKILAESIEAIKSETEHMKKLVEQLLFLARGDSGKTRLNMEPFSLNDMMQEVYDESSMIDQNHVYRFKPCEEAPAVTGDNAMLKQTVRILIDNAAKYAPGGSVITLKTEEKEKNLPAMIIQDEGIGIAGSDMSHVFDRFYRSDPARTKDSGGTGLGLSIAKWIVDRHGGYFDVLSREDIGTRITVCLPQKAPSKD